MINFFLLLVLWLKIWYFVISLLLFDVRRWNVPKGIWFLDFFYLFMIIFGYASKWTWTCFSPMMMWWRCVSVCVSACCFIITTVLVPYLIFFGCNEVTFIFVFSSTSTRLRPLLLLVVSLCMYYEIGFNGSIWSYIYACWDVAGWLFDLIQMVQVKTNFAFNFII
jgi:hypothetical protein